MPTRPILTCLALVLLAASVACEKTAPVVKPTGPLQLTAFASPDAVPAVYGRLVSVTSSDAYPGWAQLWFERADSSIVTVFVNFQTGAVRDKILQIPRS